ncbi:MAG TPA: hypothetical protein VFE42_35255 [Chloroflexota bacterium]|nr:hypothetical protein [Chloroflexota bacterium]
MERCESCGAALAPEEGACPHCGATRAAPATSDAASRRPPDPVFHMDTRILSLIIVGLTLLSSTIIVILLSRP